MLVRKLLDEGLLGRDIRCFFSAGGPWQLSLNAYKLTEQRDSLFLSQHSGNLEEIDFLLGSFDISRKSHSSKLPLCCERIDESRTETVT